MEALSTKITSLPSELVFFRKKHSLTQSQFARELGVARSTVWRWETGRSTIPCIMPVTLQGLRHIFEARKSSKRRSERIKFIKKQNREIAREKAMQKLPAHMRDALNVRE